ncbi:hypothetical protein PG993_007836 [Apiospora rasikravindrae]|uniref:Uncharacterized protein n=1 Tax=Apiospora rasikravindrae TaxID=990691 RepID=A0ABR1T0E4_9PEZI
MPCNMKRLVAALSAAARGSIPTSDYRGNPGVTIISGNRPPPRMITPPPSPPTPSEEAKRFDCSTVTKCIDYMNECGQIYGGYYSICSPTPIFTPPPCPSSTTSTPSRPAPITPPPKKSFSSTSSRPSSTTSSRPAPITPSPKKPYTPTSTTGGGSKPTAIPPPGGAPPAKPPPPPSKPGYGQIDGKPVPFGDAAWTENGVNQRRPGRDPLKKEYELPRGFGNPLPDLSHLTNTNVWNWQTVEVPEDWDPENWDTNHAPLVVPANLPGLRGPPRLEVPDLSPPGTPSSPNLEDPDLMDPELEASVRERLNALLEIPDTVPPPTTRATHRGRTPGRPGPRPLPNSGKLPNPRPRLAKAPKLPTIHEKYEIDIAGNLPGQFEPPFKPLPKETMELLKKGEWNEWKDLPWKQMGRGSAGPRGGGDDDSNGGIWPTPTQPPEYVNCIVPGPSLKTVLLPAWACIGGILHPQTTLLPSLSASPVPSLSLGGPTAAIPTTTPPALPGVFNSSNNANPTKPGTLAHLLYNETLPIIQQFIDDPKAYTNRQRDGVDPGVVYNLTKVAYVHTRIMAAGGEPDGPNGKWFPKASNPLNKMPQLLWGEPLLLTVATSEEPVAQAAANFRDNVGHEVWDSIGRIADYMGHRAAADLYSGNVVAAAMDHDRVTPKQAPLTYTYLVGQGVVDSLTYRVGFAAGVEPGTNKTITRYFAGGVAHALGQTADALGIKQSKLGTRPDGRSRTLWDYVAPTYLAAFVNSQNHMAKYKYDGPVIEEMKRIEMLFWLGKSGPMLHYGLGRGKNLPRLQTNQIYDTGNGTAPAPSN